MSGATGQDGVDTQVCKEFKVCFACHLQSQWYIGAIAMGMWLCVGTTLPNTMKILCDGIVNVSVGQPSVQNRTHITGVSVEFCTFLSENTHVCQQ